MSRFNSKYEEMFINALVNIIIPTPSTDEEEQY